LYSNDGISEIRSGLCEGVGERLWLRERIRMKSKIVKRIRSRRKSKRKRAPRQRGRTSYS